VNGTALRAANRVFVVLCQELELLGGETIGIGGSFFKASASRTRITTKKTLEAELKTIEHDLEAYTQTLDANDDQEQHLGDRCGEDPVLAEKLEALKERQARQQVQLKPLKDSGETQHFRTDPDARALNKGKQQVTGYNVQSIYLPRRRGIAPARSAASEERHPAHPLPPPGQSVLGLPTRGGVFAGLRRCTPHLPQRARPVDQSPPAPDGRIRTEADASTRGLGRTSLRHPQTLVRLGPPPGTGFRKVRGEMSLMVLGYNVLRVVNPLGMGAFRDYCARRKQARNSPLLAHLAA